MKKDWIIQAYPASEKFSASYLSSGSEFQTFEPWKATRFTQKKAEGLGMIAIHYSK